MLGGVLRSRLFRPLHDASIGDCCSLRELQCALIFVNCL
jgi:hypothetical protein